MSVHTTVFITYTALYVLRVINNDVLDHYYGVEDYQMACYSIFVSIALKCGCSFMNCATIALFTYMTVKFSMPLAEYW